VRQRDLVEKRMDGDWVLVTSYQLELVGAAGGGGVATEAPGGVVGRRASGSGEEQEGEEYGQEESAADRHGRRPEPWSCESQRPHHHFDQFGRRRKFVSFDLDRRWDPTKAKELERSC
jgi:hypothetical protein